MPCPLCGTAGFLKQRCRGCATAIDPEARARVRKWIWIHALLIPLPSLVLLVLLLARAAREGGPDPRAQIIGGVVGALFVGVAVSAPFVWGLTRALVEWKRPVRRFGDAAYVPAAVALMPVLLIGGPFAPLLIGTVLVVFWVDAVLGARYLLGLTKKWTSVWGERDP